MARFARTWGIVLLLASAFVLVFLFTESDEPPPQTQCGPELEVLHANYVEAEASTPQHITILVDPPSNSPGDVALMIDRILPLVESRYEGPFTLRLAVHLGDGVIRRSDCLDGLGLSAVHRNDTIERRNRADLASAIRTQLERDLSTGTVGANGGVVPLFRQVGLEAPTDGGESIIIVFSDLLANDGSCLDGSREGVGWRSGDPLPYADERLARELVNRCLSQGSIDPDRMFGVWTFVGAGDTARASRFAYFADMVHLALCERLGELCG